MKIGVISDSHGHLGNARQALKLMAGIDCLIHCGDHYRDAVTLAREYNLPVYGVNGNCDPGMGGAEEKIIEVMGASILITHGHRQRVKHSLDTLYRYAEDKRVQAVVFGHTHIPCQYWKGDLLLFNPGSITYPRGERGASYGVLQISQVQMVPALYYLE